MKYTVLFIILVLIAAFFAGSTSRQAPSQPKEIKIRAVVIDDLLAQ